MNGERTSMHLSHPVGLPKVALDQRLYRRTYQLIGEDFKKYLREKATATAHSPTGAGANASVNQASQPQPSFLLAEENLYARYVQREFPIMQTIVGKVKDQ